MAAAGVVSGLAVAALATQGLSRFLYEVTRFDPLSLSAAAGIVILLALLAATLPTLRAARMNPARVLGEDGSCRSSRKTNMLIRDKMASVEIALRQMGQVGTPSEGDLGVDVAATSAATGVGGPFAGRNDSVWIGRDEWARFLEDLRRLERARRAEARVESMSPGEFRLAVIVTGRAGDVAADGWVGRRYAARDGIAHDRVSFSVELDPSALPLLVRQFEAFAPAR